MKFELDANQITRVNEWLKAIVYPTIIEKQKQSETLNENPFAKHCWELGYPYEGAIGGGVTYAFTPTSIGDVCNVIYKTFDNEFKLDISNYDEW